MKIHVLSFVLLSLTTTGHLAAQPKRMVRLYEENDMFNIRGHITDKAYTNGTRLEYFHQNNGALASFIYRLMPKAGDSSSNTRSWSINQIMITPTDISRPVPKAGDYYYSGALFVTHSLQSINKERKVSVQSEWIIGLMGPPALAKETQTWVHRVIGSQRPMGWDYQLATDLLFNYNLMVEKGLASLGKVVEVVSGAQAYAGTMVNGGSVYGVVKIGKRRPYFEDIIRQHVSDGKLKWYVQLRPAVDVVFYNALWEGGFFNDHPLPNIPADKDAAVELRRVGHRLDIGVGAARDKFSISFTQKTFSTMLKGLPEHTVGSITLGYAW